MNRDEIKRALSAAGWLSKQPPDVIDAVVAAGREGVYGNGDTIAELDAEGSRTVFAVVTGGAGIYVANDWTGPSLASIARQGTWFGMGPLFTRDTRRNLGFKAVDITHTFEIEAPQMTEIAAHFGFSISGLSAFAVNIARDIVADLLIREIDRRILATLLRITNTTEAKNRFLISQADLAEMANCSRVSVNKFLGQLSREGLIATSYQHIQILDREALIVRVCQEERW